MNGHNHHKTVKTMTNAGLRAIPKSHRSAHVELFMLEKRRKILNSVRTVLQAKVQDTSREITTIEDRMRQLKSQRGVAEPPVTKEEKNPPGDSGARESGFSLEY